MRPRNIRARPGATIDRHDAEIGRRCGRAATFIESSAEAIPIDDHSVETIVTTWALCTIPQAIAAIAETRRVLRPCKRGRGMLPKLALQQSVIHDFGINADRNRYSPRGD